MLQIVALLTEDSWDLIYDCNMFIVQTACVVSAGKAKILNYRELMKGVGW